MSARVARAGGSVDLSRLGEWVNRIKVAKALAASGDPADGLRLMLAILDEGYEAPYAFQETATICRRAGRFDTEAEVLRRYIALCESEAARAEDLPSLDGRPAGSGWLEKASRAAKMMSKAEARAVAAGQLDTASPTPERPRLSAPPMPLTEIDPSEFVQMLRHAKPSFGSPRVSPTAPLRSRSEALRLAAVEPELVEIAKGWRPSYAEPPTEARQLQRDDPALYAAVIELGGIDERTRWLLSDYWLVGGDVRAALDALDVSGAETMGLMASRRMNLKRVLNIDVEPREVLSLTGRRLTAFGRQNIEAIRDVIEMDLAERRRLGAPLIDVLFEDPEALVWCDWLIFNATSRGAYLEGVTEAVFHESDRATDLFRAMHRSAENVVREDGRLPRVGEGWIGEARLFHELAARLKTVVQQHGRPDGFGLQHLDVWMPEWRIGLEYQGEQHDRPVEFFGGESGYRELLKRDEEKRTKASRLGIIIIEVRPGYSIEAVIEQIGEARRRQ